MSSAPPEFDDPQLKATVRRACAGPATPELRARIADLVRRETTPARRPAFLRPLALAAMVLIAVGTVPLLWREYREARERREELAANLPLFNAMVEAFERPFARDDALPTTDRAALRAALSARLGRPVPVPDWRAQGWQLTGAAIAPVGAHAAAQLRYGNAGRTRLFLSLPAGAFTEPEGDPGEHREAAGEPEVYQFTVNHHPIVGFVRDAGLHCTVGDATATTGELAALRVD